MGTSVERMHIIIVMKIATIICADSITFRHLEVPFFFSNDLLQSIGENSTSK